MGVGVGLTGRAHRKPTDAQEDNTVKPGEKVVGRGSDSRVGPIGNQQTPTRTTL